MKIVSALLALSIVAVWIAGCSTDTVTEERMVIAPRTLQFVPGDSVETVSITHTCTCPFTWWSSFDSTATWLSVPATMHGDHPDVQITVDRSKMPTDSVHAFIRITSNAYGIDSIEVIAKK